MSDPRSLPDTAGSGRTLDDLCLLITVQRLNVLRCGRGSWWGDRIGGTVVYRLQIVDTDHIYERVGRDDSVLQLENTLTEDTADDVAPSGDPLRSYPFTLRVAVTRKAQVPLAQTPSVLLWFHKSRVQAIAEAAAR